MEKLEKVLDRLATSEKTAIVLKHAPGGKMRVTSGSWGRREGDLRDQVLDVPNVDNRLHAARKPRKPDEWDPPITSYDPYGLGQPVTGDMDFVSADDFVVTRNAARPLRITRLS